MRHLSQEEEVTKMRWKFTSYKKKKSGLKPVLTIAGVLLLVLVLGSLWWTLNTKAVSNSTARTYFELKPGMSAQEVALKLEEQGLIRNATAFRYLSKLENVDSKLAAGEYCFSPSMSPNEIIQAFLKGPAPDVVKITIPEGYTIEQIIAELAANNLGEEKKLYEAMESFTSADYDFLADVGQGENRLEGFLFPDTYFFDRKEGSRSIIDRFLNRFAQEVTAEVKSELSKREMTVYEWVTKASIVEREARKAEEREIIAGVFENRLRMDMPLQSCATVQYILGEAKPVLSTADTEIDSPYNTYQNLGLPPGPIANPGHASLEAALYPADTDYLYFSAKPDGSHAFAVTYDEHLRNVAK